MANTVKRNPRVRLIAAIGNQGQIGLDGKLPWKRTEGDLMDFAIRTAGGVLIVGNKTAQTMPIDRETMTMDRQRDVVIWDGREDPEFILQTALERPHEGFWGPLRTVWVCGGALTYKAFAPFCSGASLTFIDYDGPADTWFPYDALLRVDD